MDEQNKNAIKGFAGIAIIIVIIVGVVMVFLPSESETVQNEPEKPDPINTQKENNVEEIIESSNAQDNNQTKLIEEIQETKKELQYLEELKQKDPSELDTIDQMALKGDLQKYKDHSEQRIERLNTLKQQGLEFLDTEKEILDYVFGYRGKDNLGNNLQREMVLYMMDVYPETFSEENPFMNDHKYYVTSAVDSETIEISMGDAIEERYRYTYFLIFTPEYGKYKTVFAFLFDTETYKIVGDNELGKSIIKILDAKD